MERFSNVRFSQPTQGKSTYRKYQLIPQQFTQKRGNVTGYDGFKKILGTKIHVATEQNGLPISIVCKRANEHDSTKFIDVLENISEYLDDEMANRILTVYADRGYDVVIHQKLLQMQWNWMLHSIQEKFRFIVPENQQNI